MSFLKIAYNKLNGQANEESFMHSDENVSQLKQEIARLNEIIRFQEAKIAHLYAMLTERDSEISKRERAWEEKAKLVAASVQKMQEVKITLGKKAVQARTDLEQKERQHQEDLHKISLLEQYGQRMAQALKEAAQKINILQQALMQTQTSKDARMVGNKNVQRHGTTPPFLQQMQHPTPPTPHREGKLVSEIAPDEASPLGYTPPQQNHIYLRSSSNLSIQDTRFHEMESKLDKVIQELARMKSKGEDGSATSSVMDGRTTRDASPVPEVFFEELKNFLDFQ